MEKPLTLPDDHFIISSFIKHNLSRAETCPPTDVDAARKENLLKGTLHVEHELGLGKKPNVVPPDDVKIDGEPRTVELGWHPVAGSAGKWFAEQTRLGKAITEEIHKSPDPTQHWAVLVGDYVHELWMDGMY